MVTIGETVSHYRIIEKLGDGGMSTVYRAHDESLDRDVAMKVLRSGILADDAARGRLRKEARALSKLSHPNIEILFEFNTEGPEEFLTVEFVAGSSLSDKLRHEQLTEKEIVHLGVQLADGLAAAHSRGVVHCDLKPSNVRVTPEGKLKIIDFGIARLKPPADQPKADGTTWSSSGTPAVMGTLPYMAPEQLRSEATDGRTDIYAAGVILYEAVTHRRPFQEDTTPVLIDDILRQPPVSPRALNSRISPELERIILKCLQKESENRYQSAQELEVDLRQLMTPTTASVAPVLDWRRTRRGRIVLAVAAVAVVSLLIAALKGSWWRQILLRTGVGRVESVAVLPLQNLSNDPEQDYFADGMTDELITDLAHIKALRVISRTSAMRYKGTAKTLREIAEELNVDAVLEGSVLRSGNRVRITAQLIQAATDRHLWAESYERDIRDVLSIQSEVARAVANEVQIKLSAKEAGRLDASPTVKTEAYEAYLRGRFFWNKRDRESVAKGLNYFQQAIQLDPSYALAHTGAADSYLIMGLNYWLPPSEAYAKAKAAARQALEIDDTLGEAHASMIVIKELEWDWQGAQSEAVRAVDLNPGYATAHQWYSGLLTLTGRHEEAIAEARSAAERDPLSAIVALHVGQTYYYARRFSEARFHVNRSLEISPDFFQAHYYLAAIDIEDGKIRDGITELRDVAARFPRDDDTLATLGYAYAIAGMKGDAQAVAKDLIEQSRQRYVPPSYVALVYAGLGKIDDAFRWLEVAYEQHDRELPWIGVDPMFEALRSDPRYLVLARRMKLPQAEASGIGRGGR